MSRGQLCETEYFPNIAHGKQQRLVLLFSFFSRATGLQSKLGSFIDFKAENLEAFSRLGILGVT